MCAVGDEVHAEPAGQEGQELVRLDAARGEVGARDHPHAPTLLHFATSSFPDASWLGGAFSDAERRTILDYAFERWKKRHRCSRPC